jgi:hypothetical protein
MTPLDLTKGRPRAPRDLADGIVFLPRTIDKARALLPGGNPGAYGLPGLSQKMFEMLGIDAAAFVAEVGTAQTDDQVVAWIRDHGNWDAVGDWNQWILNRVVTEKTHDEIAAGYPCYARNPHEKHYVSILEMDDRDTLGEELAITAMRGV